MLVRVCYEKMITQSASLMLFSLQTMFRENNSCINPTLVAGEKMRGSATSGGAER